MRGANGSAEDPFVAADWSNNTQYFQERLKYWRAPAVGYARRDPRLVAGERTGVFLVAGQSNGAAYATGTLLTSPVNASKVDSLSIFDGGLYAGYDPGPNMDGVMTGWVYRLADRLITNGHYDRVIMVPFAMGSAGVAYWAPGGVLERFIGVAVRRCAALGLPITALLWQQGEREASEALSTSYYQPKLQATIEASRAVGLVAPWFVAKSTWNALTDAQDNNIRAGLANVVNGVDVFAGADTDTLTAIGGYRASDGSSHFNVAGCNAAAALWETALMAVL